MPRILLVEDDHDNRTILRIYLEHVGHEVIEAHDGNQALEQARGELPDLILLDIGLPGVDGWEVARTLKSEAGTETIPIIALTGYVVPFEGEEPREGGCDAFLAKPIEPRRVAEAVNRALAD